MIINTNVPALNTHRQMGINQNAMQSSMEKLSSGLRINRAGDDAAGLAISEKMRAQINGLDQASRNAQDGISLIQTAEGALDETHSILQRMRELAVQSANDTNTNEDRAEIQKEINQLTNEIDRIANTTEFNTQNLLDGSLEGLRDKKAASVALTKNTSAEITVAELSAAQLSGTNAISKDLTVTISKVKSEPGLSGATTKPDSDMYEVTNALGETLTLTSNASGLTLTGITANNSALGITGLDKMVVGDSITLNFKAVDEGNADATKALSFQIGANTGQNILVGVGDMSSSALGVRTDDGKVIDVTSASKANAAIETINNAIETVSAQRSDLGAYQNRLEHTISNLDNSAENLSAAESRIRDVDMAAEMMEMMRANILSQASQSMLAQANQQPQSVLQLLG